MAKGSYVNGLALDQTNLYAAGSLMGTLGIYAIPLDGGPPALIVNGRYPTRPHGMAVAAGTLYWSDHSSTGVDGVYSAPSGGGAYSMFAAGGGDLTVSNDTLFFFTDNCVPGVACVGGNSTLMAAPISSGPPRVLWAPHDVEWSQSSGIAADAQGVYLISDSFPNPSATVVFVPLDGGSAVTIWSSAGTRGDITVTPYGIAWLAAQNLDSHAVGDVSIFSFAVGNISVLAPSIFRGYLSPGLTLASDNSSLYWLAGGDPSFDLSASPLSRVSAGSGPIQQTVSPGSGVVVVDATSIYWIGQAPEVGIQIMRLAK